MQISGICNKTFGLKFTDNMYELLNNGRQYVAKRNSRSLKFWANDKNLIRDMYDNSYKLDAETYENGSKNIYLVEPKGTPYLALQLPPDEILDRTNLIRLRIQLKDMQSIFKKQS